MYLEIWSKMDEDLTIINSNTRKEKIKNFLVTNKKIISYFLTFILILIFIFFGYQSYSKSKIKKISDEYNSAIKDITIDNMSKTYCVMLHFIWVIITLCILVQHQLPLELPCFSFTTIANSYLGVSMYSTCSTANWMKF